MASCKDCIHYEPCFSGGVSMWNNIEQTPEDCCKYFASKPLICKECKYFMERDEKPSFCSLRRRWINDYDYCSDAVRKNDVIKMLEDDLRAPKERGGEK